MSFYDTPKNENYAEAGGCLGCVPKYRRIFQGRMTEGKHLEPFSSGLLDKIRRVFIPS